MTATTTLRKTAFHDAHVARGAKMVEYAGWSMPLHFGSILDEHERVRTKGGVFDVSHMGRFEVSGRDAARFFDLVCTRQIHGMPVGAARYSLVCNAEGGCRDDVLVYRTGETDYLMVCNAANREKLLEHFAAVRGDLVFRFEDITLKSAMLAVQGPAVMDLIAKYSKEVPSLKRFRCVTKELFGLELLIARTGYTGEDGVEIIFRTDSIVAKLALPMLEKALIDKGDGIGPAGLGARDSLRLEAAMALYGHEIDEETDPISAGLNFAVTLERDPEAGTFIGQPALERIKADGPVRRLVGLQLDSPRAARQGMTVQLDAAPVGRVTSGVKSPTLGTSIAMAYVDAAHAEIGTALSIDLGRASVPATVVALPFYKR